MTDTTFVEPIVPTLEELLRADDEDAQMLEDLHRAIDLIYAQLMMWGRRTDRVSHIAAILDIKSALKRTTDVTGAMYSRVNVDVRAFCTLSERDSGANVLVNLVLMHMRRINADVEEEALRVQERRDEQVLRDRVAVPQSGLAWGTPAVPVAPPPSGFQQGRSSYQSQFYSTNATLPMSSSFDLSSAFVQSGQSTSFGNASTPQRRTRWDAPALSVSAADESKKRKRADADASSASEPARKKSRWDNVSEVKLSAAAIEAAASLGVLLAPGATDFSEDQKETMRLRLKLEELAKKLMNPAAAEKESPRSPSPEPTYDGDGVRTNTRARRIREAILIERREIMTRLQQLDPSMMDNRKFSKRFNVPVKENPDYNFVGLFLGPRGSNHKRMEAETGAKIAMFGKGAYGRVRLDGREKEDLHIVVESTSSESFEKACKMVEELLVPKDESENVQRALQLRELAAINGTLIGEITCHSCHAKGHKMQDCPERRGAGWSRANVMCDECGAASHITRDCPVKLRAKGSGSGSAAQIAAPMENVYAEFESFMAEVSGDKYLPASSQAFSVGMIKAPQAGAGSGSGSSVPYAGYQGPPPGYVPLFQPMSQFSEKPP